MAKPKEIGEAEKRILTTAIAGNDTSELVEQFKILEAKYKNSRFGKPYYFVLGQMHTVPYTKPYRKRKQKNGSR